MLRAKQSFLASPRRFVSAGDVLDDKDPIVKGREALFEPVAVTSRPGDDEKPSPAQAKKAKKAASSE
jgi:hypothetical protein